MSSPSLFSAKMIHSGAKGTIDRAVSGFVLCLRSGRRRFCSGAAPYSISEGGSLVFSGFLFLGDRGLSSAPTLRQTSLHHLRLHSALVIPNPLFPAGDRRFRPCRKESAFSLSPPSFQMGTRRTEA